MEGDGDKPGSYYVGIWYESSSDGIEARLHYTGPMWAYLNGRALQLSTHSDPVQVAPGIYFAEAQSKVAEPLKDGDEITVLYQEMNPRLARSDPLSRKSRPAATAGCMETTGPICLSATAPCG